MCRSNRKVGQALHTTGAQRRCEAALCGAYIPKFSASAAERCVVGSTRYANFRTRWTSSGAMYRHQRARRGQSVDSFRISKPTSRWRAPDAAPRRNVYLLDISPTRHEETVEHQRRTTEARPNNGRPQRHCDRPLMGRLLPHVPYLCRHSRGSQTLKQRRS
jgi:hypothetical protein